MKGKILTITNGLDKSEWLECRKKGLGGSDIGAICGLNAYSSPIDVYLDKLGLKEEKADNEAMRQGRDFEDYVAKRFEEATGKKVRRKNAILQHEEYEFMLANIDRDVVGENSLLEIKTTNMMNESLWKDGKIPESYELQCHHYMAVTGADKCYIACLIFNRDFVIREILRDEEVVESIIRIEKEFWENHVVKKEMPAPDGSKAAGEILKTIYADTDPEGVIELIDFDEKLRRYDEVSELLKTLEKEADTIKQEIQTEMKENEIAFCGDRKITWRQAKGKTTFDSKALERDHSDIFSEYVKCGNPYRVFKI